MNILHLLKLLKKKVHIFNTKLITDKDMVNRKEQSIFFVQNHQLKVSTDVFNYSYDVAELFKDLECSCLPTRLLNISNH